MILNQSERARIRECNLEWHCKEITVFRSVLPDKLLFSGYGIIKISENGQLFLDFVCNQAAADIDYDRPIPENRSVAKDRLSMTLILLDGTKLTTEGFRIKLSPLHKLRNNPIIFQIGLSAVTLVKKAIPGEGIHQSLYLEFGEDFKIPRNVSNKTESTTGESSFSWNQTRFTLDTLQVDIIRHRKYTSVSVYGSDYLSRDVEDALKFYLGFTSGQFPQPFYSRIEIGLEAIEKIISIDRQILTKSISAPINHAVYDENNQPLDKFHFQLFVNIYSQIIKNRSVFESVYSQWGRVWHASQSPEIGILTLSLSTSIEGIINDVYIKKIEWLSTDKAFEEKKGKIAEIIDSIDSIEEPQRKLIVSFVNKWGNVHPKRALEFLAEHGVITDQQVASWIKLRNSAAHPRLMVQDESRRIKDMTRTFICLGLFYRLVLNVFGYKGAQYTYEHLGDNRLFQFEYIPILGNFEVPIF